MSLLFLHMQQIVDQGEFVSMQGAAKHRGSVHAPHLAALGLNLCFIQKSFFSDVAELIDCKLRRHWSVQSLIADRTHPVLDSGKLALQKSSYHNSLSLFE